MNKNDKYPIILLVIFIIIAIWSAINPHDYTTWILEVFPALIGVTILIFTYKKFRFSNFTYTLILIHAIILFVGGHYTYAEVPLGYWMEQWFGWTRNNYDKIGHLAQGIVPAIIARELLIRKAVVKVKSWLNYIIISICLAISAFYELLEWLGSVMLGSNADAFLGTQGYVWDTQSDMLYALIGAILALILFSKLQDKSMILNKNSIKKVS